MRSRASDTAGNVEAAGTVVTFSVDGAGPGAPVDLTAVPSGWSNVDSFDVSWTNPPDPAGIAGAWYKLGTPPGTAGDGIFVAGAGLANLSDLSVGGDGVYDLYVWLQDGVGNADHTQWATAKLYLDTTAPGAPTSLDAEPDGWQMVNDFSVTWRNPVDLSGISGAYWKLDDEPEAASDGAFVAGAGLERLDNLVVPADGQHDLYLWLADGAENADHRNRNVLIRAFAFDGTPPTTVLALEGTEGLAGWYTSPVDGTLIPEDATSGVAGSRHRIDNGAWISDTLFALDIDGVYQVDYQSWDVAGNEAAIQTAILSIDSQPPVITRALSAPPGPGGWYTSSVTVTLTISDATSGPETLFYRVDGADWAGEPLAVQVVFVDDGQHLLEYYGVDAAGNIGSQEELLLPIDTQPPSTAYLLSGDEGLDGWYTSPVSVTLLPTDTVSGIAATFHRLNGGAWEAGTDFVVAKEGVHTLEFYSVDSLGNEEQWFPVALKVDTRAPGPPTRPQVTPATWTNINDFDVVWANPQDLSSIRGACYRLEGEPSAPDDGICGAVTGNSLRHIQVPSEGAYDLFLWLRDGAGNSDHNNRNVALKALRYDSTPPTTTLTISGSLGWSGWYTAPVTLLLDVEDALSGPGNGRYRVDNGPWQAGLQAVVGGQDKHVVENYGVDVAGNEEMSQTVTLRLDLQAPGPPTSLVVGPQGWSRENRFQVSWTNPLDFSGIAGAFYRFDTPPASPYNGTLVTTTRTITNMVVPSEGRHDLYLWLVDAAGNANPNRWVMAPDAVWYDGTPPTTTLVIDGTPGNGGWYTSDLEVSVVTAEGASGVARTSYQINGGGWISGTQFSLTGEGPYNVEHYGVDVAGNVEMTRTTWAGIDRLPPESSIVGMATYQTSSIFTVRWQGSDGNRGSGVTGYDLQVRQGSSGPWLTWRVNTPLTSALFAGQPGRTYYFRVRARDRAGHVEPYTAGDGDARTAVQIVANHDFEDQVFDPWGLYGALAGRSVVTQTLSPRGETTWVAQLGSPAYGPNTDLNAPGTVPVGAAVISQTVTVPEASNMVAPALTLWYRIFSYDLLWSVRHQRFYDTFEVTIHSSEGNSPALVLRDGNDGGPDPQLGVDYGVLKDLGWRYATIGLTDYAGQTIKIAFANHNRWDKHFNTWTFVDDVQIVDSQAHVRRYLPLLSASGAAQAAGSQETGVRAGGTVDPPQQRPPGGWQPR